MGRKLNIAESEFVKEWGMTNQKRGYLVAYDISDDCCRSHVAKILQHYGERLQYSVFLLRVRPSMMLDVCAHLLTAGTSFDDVGCPYADREGNR